MLNKVASLWDRTIVPFLWRWWPLIAIFTFFLITDCAVFSGIDQIVTSSFGMSAFVGYVAGQLAVVIIIAGLAGRNWIIGWFASLAIVWYASCTIVVISTFSTAGIINSTYLLEGFAIQAVWPMLLVAGGAPIAMFRTIAGWSLRIGGQTDLVPQRGSIEDLLLSGVVVACAITMLRLPDVIIGPDSAPNIYITCAVFAIASVLIVLPSIYVTFRMRTWGSRLAGWAVLYLVAVVFSVVVNHFVSSSSPVFEAIAGTLGGAFPMLLTGTTVVWMGVHLTRFRKDRRSADTQDPADQTQVHLSSSEKDKASAETTTESQALTTPGDSWLADEPQSDVNSEVGTRWAARGIALTMLGLAATTSVLIANSQAKEFRAYKALYQAPYLVRELVSLDYQYGAIHGLDIKSHASFSWLNYFSTRNIPTEIERVRLCGKSVNNDDILKLVDYHHLKTLDVSESSVTIAGLQELARSVKLTALSVANTTLSFPEVISFARTRGLLFLDVSGTNVTDDQLVDVDLGSLDYLSLANNPITDEGLKTLLSRTNKLRTLNVSGTKITGSGLVANCPQTLIADETPIDDRNLLEIAKANPIVMLSICDTQITIDAVVQIAKAKDGGGLHGLRIGGGVITEGDLAKFGQHHFAILSLNRPNHTGALLALSNVTASTLDLSNSGVNDLSLGTLSNSRKGSFNQIDLSHTAISDAATSRLLWLRPKRVSLVGTNVTIDGVKQLSRDLEIVIRHDQFQPEKTVQLHDNSNVYIDDDVTKLRWERY